METKNWYSLPDAAKVIALRLHPLLETETMSDRMGRVVTEGEQYEALTNKAKAGEITLHTIGLANIPLNEVWAYLAHNNGGLTKDSLEKYAIDLGLGLFADSGVVITHPKVIEHDIDKPWLVHNPSDPDPILTWYIPARYFARKLVSEDVTLLTNRNRLAHKIAELLPKVNVLKRGGKKPLDAETIKKALNISFE